MSNDNAAVTATRTSPPRAHLAIWLAGTAALAVIVLDQLSKAVIIREIGPDASRHTIELLLGVQLSFVRNTGSAFGLFQGQGSILTVLVFAALGFLAVFFYRNARRDPLIALALGLQIGGAIGNLIDRIRHDYVVDFVDVGRFPTFNLADSAITVGTVLLVYALLFREGQQQTLPATDADAEQPAMPQRET